MSFSKNAHDILLKVSYPVAENAGLFVLIFILLGWTYADDILNIKNWNHVWDILRKLSIVCLWSYFLCSIFFFIKKKWIKRGVLFFLFFFILVDLFLQIHFGTGITPNVFILIAETNLSECIEFVTTFYSSDKNICFLFNIAIFGIIAYICFKGRSLLKHYFHSLISAVVLIVVLTYGVINCKTYFRLFSCKSMDEVMLWKSDYFLRPSDIMSNIIYSSYGLWLTHIEIKKAIAANKVVELYSDFLNNPSDSLSIIVVIGESYIKYHSSLYGYILPTCPNLEKERSKDNLYVFKDVVTPYNLTSNAIKNIMSCNSISERENWFEKPFFPAIMKKGGYYVMMYDNQRTYEKNSAFTFSLNSYLYNGEICQASYDYCNKHSMKYDGEMANIIMPSKHSRELVLVHLMGQHNNPVDRYPHRSEFIKFTRDSIQRDEIWMTNAKRQEIADYDNATLYNDYVIEKIIKKWRDRPTVLIYFSDHGEDVYDSGNQRGRTLTNSPDYKSLKYQYEVPFVIWCSDRFKVNHPQTINQIKRSTEKPFMTDNLCQVIMGLSNIMPSTIYYKERDLLSPDYKCGRRIVNGTTDYDKTIRNQH